jgi:hypothetical protein
MSFVVVVVVPLGSVFVSGDSVRRCRLLAGGDDATAFFFFNGEVVAGTMAVSEDEGRSGTSVELVIV